MGSGSSFDFCLTRHPVEMREINFPYLPGHNPHHLPCADQIEVWKKGSSNLGVPKSLWHGRQRLGTEKSQVRDRPGLWWSQSRCEDQASLGVMKQWEPRPGQRAGWSQWRVAFTTAPNISNHRETQHVQRQGFSGALCVPSRCYGMTAGSSQKNILLS